MLSLIKAVHHDSFNPKRHIINTQNLSPITKRHIINT